MDKYQYSSTKLMAQNAIFSEKSVNSLRHVALIMDGNRRWAKERGLGVHRGYQEGVKRLFEVVQGSIPFGIKNLTVYAFSTENWKRSEKDLSQLMHIFYTSILSYKDTCVEKGVRVEILGDITPFPLYLRLALQELAKVTENQSTICLSVALNYGGRDEIRRAIVQIAKDMKEGKIQEQDITEDFIGKYMYTKDMRDPDLLIRTSGEQRMSNFLLWQSPYAEIYFTETMWPDFDVPEFQKAIIAYQERKRRYGG